MFKKITAATGKLGKVAGDTGEVAAEKIGEYSDQAFDLAVKNGIKAEQLRGDDETLGGVLKLIHGFLPFPVRAVVWEQPFVDFMLARRDNLAGMLEAAEKRATKGSDDSKSTDEE